MAVALPGTATCRSPFVSMASTAPDDGAQRIAAMRAVHPLGSPECSSQRLFAVRSRRYLHPLHGCARHPVLVARVPPTSRSTTEASVDISRIDLAIRVASADRTRSPMCSQMFSGSPEVQVHSEGPGCSRDVARAVDTFQSSSRGLSDSHELILRGRTAGSSLTRIVDSSGIVSQAHGGVCAGGDAQRRAAGLDRALATGRQTRYISGRHSRALQSGIPRLRQCSGHVERSAIKQ